MHCLFGLHYQQAIQSEYDRRGLGRAVTYYFAGFGHAPTGMLGSVFRAFASA